MHFMLWDLPYVVVTDIYWIGLHAATEKMLYNYSWLLYSSVMLCFEVVTWCYSGALCYLLFLFRSLYSYLFLYTVIVSLFITRTSLQLVFYHSLITTSSRLCLILNEYMGSVVLILRFYTSCASRCWSKRRSEVIALTLSQETWGSAVWHSQTLQSPSYLLLLFILPDSIVFSILDTDSGDSFRQRLYIY